MVFNSLQDPELITAIKNGQIGVLPTDTVYGIAALAYNPSAVARLYEAKHREHKPGTTIAASVEQLERLGIGREYLDRVAHFWPAPLSVIIPLSDQLNYVHVGLGDAPFRVVADPDVRALLEQTGPLLTSSANQPSEPIATNLQEAQDYFGDTVDFYVDDGQLPERAPSTIVRFAPTGELEVLRQGAVIIK